MLSYPGIHQQSIVVQKYGGTSVGDLARIEKVADRTATLYQQGYRHLAIVVSAMAGETNRLASLVSQLNPKAHSSFYDMAMAAGEQVSVTLLAAALEKRGICARPLLGFQLGVLTTNQHQNARIQSINTRLIYDLWQEEFIPIVAGFQGITADGYVTTLGRGGSDTSAVALAVALSAHLCEINTDVAGVLTADPRVVAEAQIIRDMDYDLALELSALGGKVLHSRCVELAAKYGLPVVIRDSFNDNPGEYTMLRKWSDEEALESPVVSAVTLERDVVRVTLSGKPIDEAFICQLFGLLAQREINVDVIVFNERQERVEQGIGFSCKSADVDKLREVVNHLLKNQPFSDVKYNIQKGLAKVSLVGLGMVHHHGVASRAFSVLAAHCIPLRMVSTSEIKISIIMDDDKAAEACQLLHQEFQLSR